MFLVVRKDISVFPILSDELTTMGEEEQLVLDLEACYDHLNSLQFGPHQSSRRRRLLEV